MKYFDKHSCLLPSLLLKAAVFTVFVFSGEEGFVKGPALCWVRYDDVAVTSLEKV
ncbi:hypothetical protein BDW68DRAFT_154788, partial [Aspergillus falconensis]